MLTMNDIHTLASRPERSENSVLTVYLNVDQSQQANLNRGFESKLKDLLVGVRNTIKTPEEMKAFQSATRSVEEYMARYEVGARGLAVAVDTSDGFVWGQEIDFPLADEIRWGREIFVRPLAAGIDEYERAGIALVDRAHLRLFTMFLGEVKEHIREEFDHRSVRHNKTVGMDRLGSASHAQRKADAQIHLNLARVAKDIDALMRQSGARRLILAGSPEITAELKGVLPKRLASQVIGTANVPISAPIQTIQAVAASVAEEFERATEEALVAGLVTSAAKSARVAVGLGRTLFALNQRRIWQLVYAEEFRSPGFECPQCGAMYAVETPACSFCGSTPARVPDIVERAVDCAVRRSARVEIIRSREGQSALINAGGIGAFLRTRTATALVS
jgi:hypothetical protein